MIKANDVVLWKGPNSMCRRWADVVSVEGNKVKIKLRHDIFDWSPGKGTTIKEGAILEVSLGEITYNQEYYDSQRKIKEHKEKKLNTNITKKAMAAGEIW